MKNVVRGGAILVLSCMFVVVFYAQAEPESTIAIAIGSHSKINNNISEITSYSAATPHFKVNALPDNSGDVKKLIKPTASIRASSAGASRSFSATAYCLQGRTALGHGVRRGLIAADPRVLKLGSRVNLSGGGYTGSYLVSDTGGAIKGNKIDIWMPSCSEAKRFGRRTVQIN